MKRSPILFLLGLALTAYVALPKGAPRFRTKPGQRYMVTQRIENTEGTGFTPEFLASFASGLLLGDVQAEPVVEESPNSIVVTYRFTAVNSADLTPGKRGKLGPYATTVIHAHQL